MAASETIKGESEWTKKAEAKRKERIEEATHKWYESQWGYSSRLVDLEARVAAPAPAAA